MRRVAVVALLATVPIALGLGSGRAPARVQVSGATAAQRALMTSVLDAVKPTELTRVEFVPKPRSLLRFTTQHYTVRAAWEGGLSAAAFAVRARLRHIPVPTGMFVQDRGGGAGVDFRVLLRDAPRRGPTPTAVNAFERSLRSALSSSGSRVVEMRVLRPGLAALVVTVRVERPAAFLQARSDRIVGLSDPVPTGLYSVYIGLEDTHGATFFAIGGPNVGGQYVRRSLAGCTSLSTDLLGQSPPPPCPA